MLNDTTKRKINSLRQILVGKVPDPKSQVEQITNALIYKYMDDMDRQAEFFGGKASFFVGEYKKYSWKNLMDTKNGAQQMLNLYVEALERMSLNKNLSPIFRDILKGAFLPYRSPETLHMFLREIDGFTYDHSEDLGDAFEHLLSIMGSQGDAGQFRTPRHIIDFIVDVIDPQKDETILDPACGTAGFLISAYKHITDNERKKLKGGHLLHDGLQTIHNNFTGYDISPEMVKLSRVNMFLHNFPNPKISEYDTLSDDTRWGETFDVIMANPPFMTPKGGIVPHKRFQVQANRAEVLFVDYIMEHLKPRGRAGIIVPEGIIFQSGNAYKQLRKSLVEDGLFAVASLPAGVFQPYSGVKTSILFFDNQVAKKTNEILFVKIENDGFDLGAQRRENGKNDLPAAEKILLNWRKLEKTEDKIAHWVKKEKIVESGDYNLSGDRYKESIALTNQKWPMVEINEVAEIGSGNSAPQDKEFFANGKYPFFRTSDVGAVHISDNLSDSRDKLNEDGIKELKLYPKNTILFPKSGASIFLNHRAMLSVEGYVSSHLATIISNENKILPKFLFNLLKKIDAKNLTNDQNYPSLKTSEISKIKIPLPSLEIQEQIVAELDGYQKIINGSKQIVDNWNPRINIDPKWKKMKLESLVEILDSKRKPITKSDRKKGRYPYYGATGILDYIADFIFDERLVLVGEDGAKWESGDQTAFIVEGKYWVNNHAHVLRPIKQELVDVFLITYLNQINLLPFITGVTVPKLNQEKMRSIEIPLPSLDIQKKIVEKIEAERALVESSKKLIEIYEKKIKDKINDVW